MVYILGSDPMTLAQVAEYVPQWGSYDDPGDPGYIAYTRIPPEKPDHRDEMVAWLEGCKPLAREGCDEDEFEYSDLEQLDRAIEYLNRLTY